MAQNKADWLRHPYRLEDPQRLNAGDEISNGPQLGRLATSPLPFGGSRMPQCGGENKNWPITGRIGYMTLAVLGVP